MAMITTPLVYQIIPDEKLSKEDNCERIIKSLKYLMKQSNDYVINVVYPNTEAGMDPIEFADFMNKADYFAKKIKDNPECFSKLLEE
jgi:hypothetical protein